MSNEREMVSADEAQVFAQVAERTGHGDSLTARLARTVIALHAIIEGSTTAPSFEEDEAARRAGLYPVKLANRWHFYDDDGRMRALPVPPVVARPAGCICDFPNGLHRFSCARQQPTAQVTRDENGTFRVAGKDGDRG